MNDNSQRSCVKYKPTKQMCQVTQSSLNEVQFTISFNLKERNAFSFHFANSIFWTMGHVQVISVLRKVKKLPTTRSRFCNTEENV